MSAPAVVRRPAQPVAPKTASPRRLQPVTAPATRRKPKLAYALVAFAGALLIGGVQIALSLAITQDSFTLAGLSSQQRNSTSRRAPSRRSSSVSALRRNWRPTPRRSGWSSRAPRRTSV